MDSSLSTEVKRLVSSYLCFFGLFFIVYVAAIYSGVLNVTVEPFPNWEMLLIIAVACLIFAVWFTLLIHCFKLSDKQRSAMWVLVLIFLHWLAVIPYLIFVYIPSFRSKVEFQSH